jgi:hypothetical protein
MSQQWNTKLLIVKMNTKLHSTSIEFQCVRVANYVTIIKEMYKMPCETYLNDSEKEKINWSRCVEAAENFPFKENIYLGWGTHHTIFATGPLVPSYATATLHTTLHYTTLHYTTLHSCLPVTGIPFETVFPPASFSSVSFQCSISGSWCDWRPRTFSSEHSNFSNSLFQ